ncbi:MAG: regulator of sigma protease [Chloroflexota bacterium]|jgi:regulator of sigma E protease|nr:regulator of sigma protease [Chloroflexota bacterium]
MFDFIGLGNGLINVVLLLAFLVVLVVIHELGHFIVARRSGVRVHEFGVGFPPRAKVLGRDKQGTEYTLNWLPIGGFVRLEGEEGESLEKDAFVNKPLRTRLTILLAGVLMNLVLAVVVFSFIAAFADPVADVRIGEVQPGTPAATAGLVGSRIIGTDAEGNNLYDDSGDVIIAVDGQRFAVFDRIEDVTPSISYLRAHAGQQVMLTVRNAAGEVRDVAVTLRVPGPNEGPLGIVLNPRLVSGEITHDPLAAVTLGVRRTVDAATVVLRGLGQLITNFTNPPISGPVGMVDIIGQVRQIGQPIYLLWLFGVLSANLAVVNVLPFPPLDGGRAAVAIIQRATGNRISVAAERLAYLTGFLLLMALLVWVTFFDIQRLG